MLREIAGIKKVHKLYIQLLYLCNFNCKHCFHGVRLLWKESFTVKEIELLLETFRKEYDIARAVFLGGEPFLYKGFIEVIKLAKSLGLRVDVCTNGYKIRDTLLKIAPLIDNLRVSLEGLELTNDCIRRPGSFKAALETLELAKEHNIYASVTTTVNALNMTEVLPLAKFLVPYGVREIKLHCLRVLGNAMEHPALTVNDPQAYQVLHQQIAEERSQLPITILFDEDLDPQCDLLDREGVKRIQEELERVEVQPTGELYVSCKAVGADSNAFFWDKSTGQIRYKPREEDELKMSTPQVRYARV